MKPRLLVTGGNGFVGTHVSAILGAEYDVLACGRECDINSPGSLERMVSEAKPDKVLHLAAIAAVGDSFKNQLEIYQTNFLGTLNVLTALKAWGFRGRFLYVSSSQVYGSPAECDLPVSEDQRLRPLNPYGVSKLASEALCYQWSQLEDFEVILARPFNHIGPGQGEQFAIANFARQIAAIRLGLAERVINVGDIDTTRDFMDVRDVVGAYSLLLEKGQNGEAYNVCSGIERSVRSLLLRMCELAGINIEVQVDSARLRPSDQRRVCGSAEKLMRHTGWHSRFLIDQTLSDILTFWEKKLNG